MAGIVPEGEVAFGLQLPVQTLTRTLVDPWEDDATVDDLLTVARAADEAGLDFVGVCDHIAIPDNEYAARMTTTWFDTVATLGFLSAHTERVRLLSTVYVAAYRHPLQTAKAFGTLDHLSGGRVILGVGAGHIEAEFEALDIDFETRGRRLDDALAAIRGAFDDTYVSHDGEFFTYEDMGVAPGPSGRPLTTWIGGGGPAALRRVGQYGDGFIPFVQSPADYPGVIGAIRRHAEAAGRGAEQFDIGIFVPWARLGDEPDGEVGPYQLSGEPEAVAETIRNLRETGANVFHLKFRAASAADYADQIHRFMTDVAPLV